MASATSTRGLHHGLDRLAQIKLLAYFDHCYLDSHFPHIALQPEGIAAGQGEIQAEVHYKVQMA